MNYKNILLAIITATAMFVNSATAVTIIPLSVSAPNRLGINRVATNMINGSDFDAVAGTVGTASDGNVWTSRFLGQSSNTGSGNNVAGTSVLASPYTLTFDLGANYNLNDVMVWNWNGSGNLAAAVKTMEILVSSTVGGATSSLGTVGLTLGTGVAGFTGDSFSVSASDVREVQFVITEGFGWQNGDGNTLIGIAEVRFDGVTTPVPEPSSTALLGFGGLVLLRRKRRD